MPHREGAFRNVCNFHINTKGDTHSDTVRQPKTHTQTQTHTDTHTLRHTYTKTHTLRDTNTLTHTHSDTPLVNGTEAPVVKKDHPIRFNIIG